MTEGDDVAPGKARVENVPVHTQNNPIPERAHEDCLMALGISESVRNIHTTYILKGNKKGQAKLVLGGKR